MISSSCKVSTVVQEISTRTARTGDESLVTHYLKEMSSFDNDVIWLLTLTFIEVYLIFANVPL